MIWSAIVIFCALTACMTVAVLRAPGIKRVPARVWMLYGGVVIPGVLLGFLLVVALIKGETLLQRAGDASVPQIHVEARMWSWEFSYPDRVGVSSTTDVLHMPAGQPVDLVVTSADVIHSFWIPRLGGKIDAIPGRTNVIRLQADRPGTYHGICAEFCGTGHTRMLFIVEAFKTAGTAQ